MDIDNEYIEALITLHSGLKRQGPGDSNFSLSILRNLPKLPEKPRIADIGCGAGAGALLLAKYYGSRVRAVDFSKLFLEQMMSYAKQEGLEGLIEPIECDMGQLGWQQKTIDLLWSEGAAYNIGFESALQRWRRFMAENGLVVISEMNYFTKEPSWIVSGYMENAYPDIKTEEENIELINDSGYTFIESRRLPSKFWWKNYYEPLQQNMQKLKSDCDEVMQQVIQDTEEEMSFFKKHDEEYGYTFYIMRAS